MTSLLDALRDPMHALDPSSERDALTEILRVRDEELKLAREALESARKALLAKQSEVDDLTAQDRLWRRVPPVVKSEWHQCGLTAPFEAIRRAGPPFAEVYDADGLLLARCDRHQVADVIAAMLNEAAMRMK